MPTTLPQVHAEATPARGRGSRFRGRHRAGGAASAYQYAQKALRRAEADGIAREAFLAALTQAQRGSRRTDRRERMATIRVKVPQAYPAVPPALANVLMAEQFSPAEIAVLVEPGFRATLKSYASKRGFERLMATGGEAVDAAGAARLYGGQQGCTEEAVRKAAREGRLIAVRGGAGRLQFPVWQFGERGGVRDGLPEVLRILRRRPNRDELSIVTFFVNPAAALGGRRPYEVLTGKDAAGVRAVKALAEAEAE